MSETTAPAAAEQAASKTYRPFLNVILDVAGNPDLPDGYDTWGFKITRPDLRSYSGYRWPWPGGSVTDEATVKNGEPCPTARTGGFCVAADLQGAASGQHGHATILLLAYRTADVAGRGDHKIRVSHALVADVIDGQAAYVQSAGADLAGAYLTRAYLTDANLTDAYLAGANLAGADLADANLARAYLARANLAGAYLARANLTGADLAGANLTDANLTDANLARANLTGAYLAGAYLAGADLAGAYLARAYLARADLARADLAGANLAGAELRRDQLTDGQAAIITGEPSWLT